MLSALLFALTLIQSPPAAQSPPTSKVEITMPQQTEPHSLLSDLARDLAWPVAVILGIVLLRRPISEFVSDLGARASKLSVGGFALELSTARETGRDTGSFLEQLRDPGRSMVQDSSGSIQQQIAGRDPVDFVVVDLEGGKAWLTSRLFILAELTQRMRQVKNIVFVDSNVAGPQRFVGMASASRVRWALAQAYPWLEIALNKAFQQNFNWDPVNIPREIQVITTHSGGLEPNTAVNMVSAFVLSIQRPVPPAPNEIGWEQISPDKWERARWVDQPRLLRVMGTDLHTESFQRDAGVSADEVVRRVLRVTDQDYAVAVDSQRFERLIDRGALLERIAKKIADEKS